MPGDDRLRYSGLLMIRAQCAAALIIPTRSVSEGKGVSTSLTLRVNMCPPRNPTVNHCSASAVDHELSVALSVQSTSLPGEGRIRGAFVTHAHSFFSRSRWGPGALASQPLPFQGMLPPQGELSETSISF